MIVEEIMKTNVITLSPNDSILEAHKLMLKCKVRHLPIINKDKQLIGIVTDRDIRDAAPSILIDSKEQKDLLDRPVKMIMKTDLIIGHPLDFVEEIGAVFYENRVSCMPIVKDHKLVGILTDTDLLHTLIELTGASQPGSQVEIKVLNQAGVLSGITSIFSKRKANILSVLLYPDKEDEHFKIVVIRVQTMNPTGLIADLKEAGHEVLWPNLPGISL